VKKNYLITALIIVNIAVISAFIIWYCNRTYPMIGHDYRLFMPYMMDSYLHQKINGLAVQWYTPSFAGGRPVFPNPQDLEFSLPQFLMGIANPWVAILASLVVFIGIGFVATYYFLKKLVGLDSFASLLGAVFFVGNGFYFNHAAAGHVTFETFTLFPVILILLFHPRIPAWLGGLLLSFVAAVLLYSGIHNVPFFLLSALVIFPILYLYKASLWNWKRIFWVVGWGAGFSILLLGSKISAIIYFMRFFPRLAEDNYTTTLWTGMVGIVRQLLGTMTLAPIYRALSSVVPGLSAYQATVDLAKSTGTIYGAWELDASISPVLVLLLAGGAIAYLFHKPDLKARIDKKRLVAVACLVIAIWLVIENTLAKGIIYPYLKNLPILESLRVNVRNVSAFIFPLAFVGAVIFENWTRKWKSKALLVTMFLLIDGFALLCLSNMHYFPAQYALNLNGSSYQLYQCDYRPILATYDEIRYQGKTFPVENVVPQADPWMVFQDDATNMIDPYNTYFKDIYRHLDPVLHAGPVTDVTNGYYNIVDPTGYVFPEVNHSQEYGRIPVSEKAQLLDFINRRQPDWKLPLLQKILDWVSLITLIIEFCALLVLLAGKWIRIPKRPASSLRSSPGPSSRAQMVHRPRQPKDDQRQQDQSQ